MTLPIDSPSLPVPAASSSSLRDASPASWFPAVWTFFSELSRDPRGDRVGRVLCPFASGPQGVWQTFFWFHRKSSICPQNDGGYSTGWGPSSPEVGVACGGASAGSKSSTTLPDGSSQRICWPPGPITISLRKGTPSPRELVDPTGQVVDHHDEPVPPTGLRSAPVGHRARGRRVGAGEPEGEVVALGDGHRRAVLLLEREPEAGVEGNGGVDVVHDVAHYGHATSMPHPLGSST